MKTEKKKKTGTARLLELAATKKPLMIGSLILSALASVVSFVPYIAIYLIVREMLGSLPDMASLNSALVIQYGWLAFAGVVGNILLYFGALTCSHLDAFGTLYELKINFATHLAKVPLGFHVMIGSGKLRKITDENIEKVEGFIAHQLPDLAGAFVAPVAMIVILMAVDWRFGLAALLGVVIAFIMQFSLYGNEGSKAMMANYQKSIEEMNNASVEYIRGISVVKAFKQTVYSFRRLNDTIKAYTSMVIPYTLSWENSFSGFTTLVNNIYLFVLPVAIFVGMRTTDYAAFAGTVIFYLIFVQSIASILMKIMYVNGNAMRIIGGVEAMDEILAEPELAQPASPKTVKFHDVEFRDVTFSYDKGGETEALSGVSFTARQGEITAIVGPSGGGKSTIAHLIPRFFDVSGGEISIGGVDIREMDTHAAFSVSVCSAVMKYKIYNMEELHNRKILGVFWSGTGNTTMISIGLILHSTLVVHNQNLYLQQEMPDWRGDFSPIRPFRLVNTGSQYCMDSIRAISSPRGRMASAAPAPDRL